MRPIPFNPDAVIPAPFGAVAIQLDQASNLKQIQLIPASPTLYVNQQAQAIVDAIQSYLQSPKNDLRHLIKLPKGTPFQQRVWSAMTEIPLGEVMSYQALAQRVSSGARAVANACGANPLPLVIPCHRVVAKNGIGGFMQNTVGGLAIKQWLLKHEGYHFD
jgi:methylated-DNA-[protein]-cysteine S-methyltransferase